jgi:hypothetical protein
MLYRVSTITVTAVSSVLSVVSTSASAVDVPEVSGPPLYPFELGEERKSQHLRNGKEMIQVTYRSKHRQVRSRRPKYLDLFPGGRLRPQPHPDQLFARALGYRADHQPETRGPAVTIRGGQPGRIPFCFQRVEVQDESTRLSQVRGLGYRADLGRW